MGRTGDDLVLVGFMGAGKSTVGQLLADRLGRPLVDLDRVIEEMAGASIPDLFRQGGEGLFRELEARAVERLAAEPGPPRVIAAGGGALERSDNRARLAALGQWVWLFCDLRTCLARAGRDGAVRPLLDGRGGQPDGSLPSRYARRRWQYAWAPVWVDTRGAPAEEVAQRVREALRLADAGPVAGWVLDGAASYPVYAGPGLLPRVPRLLAAGAGGSPAAPVAVVADRAVTGGPGEELVRALSAAGLEVHVAAIGPGESAKRLSAVARLYTFALGAKLDRASTVLALGGGAVLDAAGFFAATYMRGVRWAALPTTLLAQVDASIGGKTAVNHPKVKNLIGAFHHPVLMAADPAVLASLPVRELRSGLAEVVKHALVGDPELLESLEQGVAGCGRPLSGPEIKGLLQDGRLVAHAARVKAVIVSEDLHEAGLRAVLNLGHTTGHALEALTGFRRLRHGEAVAIGLRIALELSRRVGVLEDGTLPERVAALLDAFGLPGAGPPALDAEAVWEAMAHDKKNRAGQRRWVLLRAAGEPVLVAGEVTFELFREVWARQAARAEGVDPT